MQNQIRTTANNAYIHVIGLPLDCAGIKIAILVGEAP
jgi:hypothetical protein